MNRKLPPPFFAMRGIAPRARRKAEFRFWSSPACHSSSLTSRPSGEGDSPTFATAPVIGPNSASHFASASSIGAVWVRSPAKLHTLSAPKRFANSAFVSASASAPRAVSATFAPSPSRLSAMP